MENLWRSVGTAVRKQVGSAKHTPNVFRKRTTESKLLRRAWPMPSYRGSRTVKSNRNWTRQLLIRPSRRSKLWQLSKKVGAKEQKNEARRSRLVLGSCWSSMIFTEQRDLGTRT